MIPVGSRDHPVVHLLVVAAAVVVALVSARDYAGGWNDGSRLATVECLVERHTLAIDDSVFVRPPTGAPSPYAADEPNLRRTGTADKLFILGHYYSDKSPVPAVLLAGVYDILRQTTGLAAHERPDRFCYWLTVVSAGLAYVVSVWCVFRIGGKLRLPLAQRLILTASFGLATVALPYACHVNNHILLLAVASAVTLVAVGLAEDTAAGRTSWPRLLGLGTLAGLGYTIDLGAGPVLLVATLGLVAFRCRRVRPVVGFALAALPWLLLHHAVNYAVGGTLGPANAVPEYFRWPGCPFDAASLTGRWHHQNLGHLLTYAAALLAGKRGFLGHNLPLFLAVAGAAAVLRRCRAERPEVVFAVGWSTGCWLLYALASNNYSGACCSVRWFVPLLAPGYYVLGLLLREWPRYLADFLVLTGCGAACALLMWWHGPWMKHMVPFFWAFQAAGLLGCLLCRRWRQRRAEAEGRPAVQSPSMTRAA